MQLIQLKSGEGLMSTFEKWGALSLPPVFNAYAHNNCDMAA